MKTLIAILTTVIGMLSFTPSEAQAAPPRSHGVSGSYYTTVEYRKVRRLVGHTRRGFPIYKWRTIKIYHKHYTKPYHRRHRH
ncbi:MAG TPA: hypothetical protein VHM91_03380 [Verrucomicrobiales bacterium]|jgi:hypothetical protein|nr:hypothetical protein [Verrucomicrobiales bacterium]